MFLQTRVSKIIGLVIVFAIISFTGYFIYQADAIGVETTNSLTVVGGGKISFLSGRHIIGGDSYNTSPYIDSVVPEQTIIVTTPDTQVTTFDIHDLESDTVSYTLTSVDCGSISVAGDPASPISATPAGVTITYTFDSDGCSGESSSVEVHLDDGENTYDYNPGGGKCSDADGICYFAI